MDGDGHFFKNEQISFKRYISMPNVVIFAMQLEIVHFQQFSSGGTFNGTFNDTSAIDYHGDSWNSSSSRL
jgi:hypothetical protein